MYAVLAVMLSFTAGCVLAVVMHPELKKWIQQRGVICFICLGCVMLGMILQMRCADTFRIVPLNWLLLIYFMVAWSGMVAGFCAFQDPMNVLIASALTAFMTFGLSLVAICIKNEMTFAYGIGATFVMATWPAIVFGVMRP